LEISSRFCIIGNVEQDGMAGLLAIEVGVYTT